MLLFRNFTILLELLNLKLVKSTARFQFFSELQSRNISKKIQGSTYPIFLWMEILTSPSLRVIADIKYVTWQKSQEVIIYTYFFETIVIKKVYVCVPWTQYKQAKMSPWGLLCANIFFRKIYFCFDVTLYKS